MEFADADWVAAAYPERAQPTENVFVRFYLKAEQDDDASLKAGHPVFVDREFVEVINPGDKTNIIHRPIEPADKQRFANAYQAWKTGQSEVVEGMPLREWPALTRSQVETLAYFKVYSVEQLAGVSDSNAQRIGPGARDWVQKAKDWLARAKSNAPIAALRKQLEEQQNLIETMTRQLKEQGAVIDALRTQKPAGINGHATEIAVANLDVEQPKRKRGRPPKVEGVSQ